MEKLWWKYDARCYMRFCDRWSQVNNTVHNKEPAPIATTKMHPPRLYRQKKLANVGLLLISVISNIINDAGQRTGGLGDGEANWHADMTYIDAPPKGCVPTTAPTTQRPLPPWPRPEASPPRRAVSPTRTPSSRSASPPSRRTWSTRCRSSPTT